MQQECGMGCWPKSKASLQVMWWSSLIAFSAKGTRIKVKILHYNPMFLNPLRENSASLSNIGSITVSTRDSVDNQSHSWSPVKESLKGETKCYKERQKA